MYRDSDGDVSSGDDEKDEKLSMNENTSVLDTNVTEECESQPTKKEE
jgi:hypothetical protein